MREHTTLYSQELSTSVSGTSGGFRRLCARSSSHVRQAREPWKLRGYAMNIPRKVFCARGLMSCLCGCSRDLRLRVRGFGEIETRADYPHGAPSEQLQDQR